MKIDKNSLPKPIGLDHIYIINGLWADRQTTNRNKTIPAIYDKLESTGRLHAWTLDPSREQPKRHKVIYMFWDSDTGKWLEAVGYSLHKHPDPELEKQADAVIDMMEKAQLEDGYLNTYFTVLEKDLRWRNLRDFHEMYNAGHLIEGAVAYYEATGKRKVLDVLARFADHIDSLFGPNEGQKRGYPGHPELELALVKLYRATGEERYLKLSKFFIDERGQQPHYYDNEAIERGEDPADYWAQDYRYCQAHEPIRNQKTATGHSVRACYLYAGVADVALETEDAELLEVSRTLWNDLTERQMYIIGGLGPSRTNEGFTFSYDLPNEDGYTETCAAIALVFWAQRMFHLDPHGRYIDVLERALYNNVLSGISYEGTHFFYSNPLTSYPHVNPHSQWSGITSDEYYHRDVWLTCPCCPPNLARLVGSIGTYMYSSTADTVYAHLYNTNQATFQLNGKQVQINQQTNYPWDEDVNLTVQVDQPTEFEIALRIPGWCRDYRLNVNGTAVTANVVDGYARIRREWANGDTVGLWLSMPAERIAAHPDVREDAGTVALQRGPVVYCLEEVDNGARLAHLVLPQDCELTVSKADNLFGGIPVINAQGIRVEPVQWSGGLYQPRDLVKVAHTPVALKAIPYYLWANRQPGEMRVWIREN
jgi:uncharacterized protein